MHTCTITATATITVEIEYEVTATLSAANYRAMQKANPDCDHETLLFIWSQDVAEDVGNDSEDSASKLSLEGDKTTSIENWECTSVDVNCDPIVW